MRNDEHLSEGTLRALDDGELPPLAALHCRLHLSRCPRCRTERDRARRLQEHTRELLMLARQGGAGAPVAGRGSTGTRSGAIEWSRSGMPPSLERSTGSRRRMRAAATGLALLTMVALTLTLRRRTDTPPSGDTARHEVCCWDLDGGGRGDDGVMIVSHAGEQLDCVVVYDDRDGSRSLTPGDLIRYASRSAGCELPPGARAGLVEPAQLAGLPVAP